VYRVAEAMTVFGVLTAGLFPIIHLGRPWFPYWLFPYPTQRQIWPNFRSPLEWDVFAVTTYLTVSTVFFLVGMIPDAAAARDRAKSPIAKAWFSIFSMGWTGANYQWKHYYGAYLFFAALATPLVFSVHSVVSWDFAMAQVPGWHSTIFAPLLRRRRDLLGCRDGHQPDHPDSQGLQARAPRHARPHGEAVEARAAHLDHRRLLLPDRVLHGLVRSEQVRARPVLVARDRALLVGILDHVHLQRDLPAHPVVQEGAANMAVLFVLCLFVNVGMWFERFVIIVTSLARPFEPATWDINYKMSWTEAAILAGSFAWFLMYFLIFIRVLPAFSIAEVKETLKAPLRRDAA
jgi:molybdopterin-containing oxidoreductase family membrane subunit